MMNDRSYLRTLPDRELMERATADSELAIVLAERLEEAEGAIMLAERIFEARSNAQHGDDK